MYSRCKTCIHVIASFFVSYNYLVSVALDCNSPCHLPEYNEPTPISIYIQDKRCRTVKLLDTRYLDLNEDEVYTDVVVFVCSVSGPRVSGSRSIRFPQRATHGDYSIPSLAVDYHTPRLGNNTSPPRPRSPGGDSPEVYPKSTVLLQQAFLSIPAPLESTLQLPLRSLNPNSNSEVPPCSNFKCYLKTVVFWTHIHTLEEVYTTSCLIIVSGDLKSRETVRRTTKQLQTSIKCFIEIFEHRTAITNAYLNCSRFFTI